jgi:hypothetical protein
LFSHHAHVTLLQYIHLFLIHESNLPDTCSKPAKPRLAAVSS